MARTELDGRRASAAGLALALTMMPLLSGCTSMTGMKSCRNGVCTTERPSPPQGPSLYPTSNEGAAERANRQARPLPIRPPGQRLR